MLFVLRGHWAPVGVRCRTRGASYPGCPTPPQGAHKRHPYMVHICTRILGNAVRASRLLGARQGVISEPAARHIRVAQHLPRVPTRGTPTWCIGGGGGPFTNARSWYEDPRPGPLLPSGRLSPAPQPPLRRRPPRRALRPSPTSAPMRRLPDLPAGLSPGSSP